MTGKPIQVRVKNQLNLDGWTFDKPLDTPGDLLDLDAADVFIHKTALRQAGLGDVQRGDILECVPIAVPGKRNRSGTSVKLIQCAGQRPHRSHESP